MRFFPILLDFRSLRSALCGLQAFSPKADLSNLGLEAEVRGGGEEPRWAFATG